MNLDPSNASPRASRIIALWLGSLAATLILCAGGAGMALALTPGRPDPSFGSGGSAAGPAGVILNASAPLPDGRVVAVGQDTRGGRSALAVARFTSHGALDSSFGPGGIVDGPAVGAGGTTQASAVALQPDGKIVAVGTAVNGNSSGMLIERFNTNGSRDTTFGSGGAVELLGGSVSGSGQAVVIQPDGKILATGSAYGPGSGHGNYPRAALVRLNVNGSPDGSFGSGGSDVIDLGPYSSAAGVTLQPDGRIVIVGSQSPNLQSVNALIARLTTRGGLDPTFGHGSGAFAAEFARGAGSSTFNAVAVRSDGRIVAAGSATRAGSTADALLVRFTSGGSPDGSFGSGGVVYAAAAVNYLGAGTRTPGASSLVLAANGDAVLAGTFVNQTLSYGALWAFTPTGAPEHAFGTNGVTVILPPAGQSAGESAIAFAADGSLIVTGGLSDAFAPSTGTVSRYGGYPPPPPPAFKASLQKTSRSYKTRSLAAHGLSLTVSCNRACKVSAVLSISASTAKTLHLKVKGRRRVTLGSVSAVLSGPANKKLTLRLNRGLIKALESQRHLGVQLQVTLSPRPSGRSQTVTRSLSLTA